MRLIKPDPPRKYLSAVRAGLKDYVEPEPANALLQNHEALEVFSLRLDAINKDTVLREAAKTAGWRYVAVEVASGMGCHVAESGRVTGVACAPEIHDMLLSLYEMEENFQNRSGLLRDNQSDDYELRALRIPGLLVEAFWLYSLHAPEDDVIVPFAGLFEGSCESEEGRTVKWKLVPMDFYSVGKFIEEIYEAADARLKAHDKMYNLEKRPVQKLSE